MFSGIVTALGKVKKINKDKIWNVEIAIDNIHMNEFLTHENLIKIGSSISCSGICLTVCSFKNNLLKFEVSDETASKTNFKSWKIKTIVNLERSLKVGDEIGGHFVSGHVDDTVKVLKILKSDDSHILRLNLNKDLRDFIVKKGSVTLNGVSLTVNDVTSRYFEVNIIPFTWLNTNLSYASLGSDVNIEIDLLARYLINKTKNN